MLLVIEAQGKWQLMLMVRMVWFDASGTVRLMLVHAKWPVMLMMLTVWFGAADACIVCAPGLQGATEMVADAHDVHGLV